MLDDKRKRAIEYLTSKDFREGDLGYGDVADRLNITPKTLYNWRQETSFQKALEEHQDKTVDERLLERIMDTGDPQAINLYYKRHGKFQDAESTTKILQMTDDERSRIEREAAERYIERHGLESLQPTGP